MKSSGLRPAVLGVVLLGSAVGLGARSCVLHRSSETVTSEHQVKQFELVQSWPTRGDTERWLAVDSRGERVLLEAKGFKLQVGRILVAGVQQILPHSPIHLADFDEAAFLNGRGVRAKYKVIWCGMSTDEMGIQGRFREAVAAVKQRVTRRCMGIGGGAPSGLLLALITGDKSALPRSTRDAFSDVGLSHLVAVSGFHVGLVAGFLLLVLRLVRCPHPWKPYVFLPLVWMYVGLCGWTGSAVRAAAMTSVAACAVALRRKPDGPTVLSAVGLLIVAMWPESMGDLGGRPEFFGYRRNPLVAPLCPCTGLVPLVALLRYVGGRSCGRHRMYCTSGMACFRKAAPVLCGVQHCGHTFCSGHFIAVCGLVCFAGGIFSMAAACALIGVGAVPRAGR